MVVVVEEPSNVNQLISSVTSGWFLNLSTNYNHAELLQVPDIQASSFLETEAEVSIP